MDTDSDNELILNVDDTDAARYAKTRILTRAGFKVIEASTGEEALSQVHMHLPALVLLDVKLPDINGMEVCRLIKTGSLPRTVLVLQSSASYLSIGDKIKSLEGGADNYLFEPFEAEELVANVRALLRLGRVERELKLADQRKNEFLAVLAHELRNPLGPIRSAAELLKDAHYTDQGKIEKVHSTILRQVSHMVRLVDDLLDVARISKAKLSLQKQAVTLQAIVDAAVETVQPLISARRHTLAVQLPTEDVWLEADEVRLAQVLGNLLSNAVKFTEDAGQIRLQVELQGDLALITVSDSGIGIDHEQLDSIFSLFEQASHVPSRGRDGLGIGLSLVKTITEMHGGSIRASSRGLAKGSTFELRLPVATPMRVQPEDAAAFSPVPAGSAPLKILIVDDNKDAAELICELLKLQGHDVIMAHTAMEALQLFSYAKPRIAILDIGLPDMDGTELAQRIRSISDGDDTYLVALTGYGSASDRQRTADAGFNAHLVKPVKLADLLELLSTIHR